MTTRIGVLTAGGDAPGLNAAIRAVGGRPGDCAEPDIAPPPTIEGSLEPLHALNRFVTGRGPARNARLGGGMTR